MCQTQVKRRTGGRSARVRNDVLTHALFELVEQGYLDFNIAHIAKRAQVHETTIYRRWPTREALMMAAISEFAQQQFSTPNSGSLQNDLQQHLNTMSKIMESQIGQALLCLAFHPKLSPELKIMLKQLWQERLAAGEEIFNQAITRGEWPAHYDQALLFNEMLGPLLSHYFLLQQPISAHVIQQRVQLILSQPDFFQQPSNNHDT